MNNIGSHDCSTSNTKRVGNLDYQDMYFVEMLDNHPFNLNNSKFRKVYPLRGVLLLVKAVATEDKEREGQHGCQYVT